jgi:hypothetical protein
MLSKVSSNFAWPSYTNMQALNIARTVDSFPSFSYQEDLTPYYDLANI